MSEECCRNCKYGQLIRVLCDETHDSVGSSDGHFNMYTCHFRRSEHFGHLMIGDHACVGFGFKERDLEKGK